MNQDAEVKALAAEVQRLTEMNAKLQTLIQTRSVTRLAEISDALAICLANAENQPNLAELLRKFVKHVDEARAFAGGIVVPPIHLSNGGH